ELVHVALADEDGVGLAQLGDDRRVVGRLVAAADTLQDLRAAGGGHAARAERVLDADVDAGELAQGLAAAALLVDGLGGGERFLARERDEAVELSVELFDPLERRLGQLGGGNLALANELGELDNGSIEKVVRAHSSTNPGTAKPPSAVRGASFKASSCDKPGRGSSARSGSLSTCTCRV